MFLLHHLPGSHLCMWEGCQVDMWILDSASGVGLVVRPGVH